MPFQPRLLALSQTTPCWLQSGGTLSDVVVSSRVRLARNIDGFSFPEQLTSNDADEIAASASVSLSNSDLDGDSIDVRSLQPSEGEFLLERNLASRELLNAERPTLLFYSPRGSHSVMVNEEDHFRIQGVCSGLDLEVALKRALRLEYILSKDHNFATSEKYGYLTSCLSNTGSGMRASIMLHLPAMARAKKPLQKALQSARAAGLAVRGVHGEGSKAIGNFYQISNQRTLGEHSGSQLQWVSDFGNEVCRFEVQLREQYASDTRARVALAVDIRQSIAKLKSVDSVTTAQALALLNLLKLGIHCGVCQEIGFSISASRLVQLSFWVQPGHLQIAQGNALTVDERDKIRAKRLRRELGFDNVS
jgi:protein arginine kinase